MSVRDVSGVLSRSFVIGFFLPAFFAVVGTWQLLTDDLRSEITRELGVDEVGILVLGGVALLVALLLVGLWGPLQRTLQGEQLKRGPFRPVRALLQRWQEWGFRRLERRIDKSNDDTAREFHTWRRLRKYPRERGRLLPTRFGNEFRAQQDMTERAWGLDPEHAWPRIETLLTDGERQLLEDARSDLALFLNLALLALAGASAVVIDQIVHDEQPEALLLLIPALALAWAFYNAAFPALSRWGIQVRASTDMHRKELFEKLGVRPSDASRVNECFARGEPFEQPQPPTPSV